MPRGKSTKSHTTTRNRVARRYNGRIDDASGFDVVTDDMTILVATTATVAEAVKRLQARSGLVYVAMTNHEGVKDAVRTVGDTGVGVMNSRGEVVLPCRR
jgi:hypothetical protein